MVARCLTDEMRCGDCHAQIAYESCEDPCIARNCRVTLLHCRFWIFALLIGAAGRVSAQAVPTRVLAQPAARSAATFMRAVDVRELSDGRVFVLDFFGEQQLVVLSPSLATSQPVGRRGQGPGEYRNPVRLWRLRGDSTGVEMIGRFQIIGPDGKLGGLINSRAPSPSFSNLAAADELGRLFGVATSSFVPGRSSIYAADSAAIERWNIGGNKSEIVGYYSVARGTQHFYSNPGRSPGLFSGDAEPFRSSADWVVTPNGQIVIVHPSPYRVDIIDQRGVRKIGMPIAFDRVRVSEEHKAEWLSDRLAEMTRSMSRMTVATRNGLPPRRYPVPVDPPPKRWPAYLPPFLQSAVSAAPDGRVWVRRTTVAGAPPTYDVFDALGKLAERVVMPRGARVVGFGKRSAYVARLDNSDFEFLERYDW